MIFPLCKVISLRVTSSLGDLLSSILLNRRMISFSVFAAFSTLKIYYKFGLSNASKLSNFKNNAKSHIRLALGANVSGSIATTGAFLFMFPIEHFNPAMRKGIILLAVVLNLFISITLILIMLSLKRKSYHPPLVVCSKPNP